MKFNFLAIVALLSTAQAISLRKDEAGKEVKEGGGDVEADNTDYTYKKVTSDPTGTYSPKENMHTGFEGTKTGNAYTYTNDSTGGHASVTRDPSVFSNHRNAVNEGSSHQEPSL